MQLAYLSKLCRLNWQATSALVMLINASKISTASSVSAANQSHDDAVSLYETASPYKPNTLLVQKPIPPAPFYMTEIQLVL
jgi:hypothetical protein